jgi:Ca2+/H+ antiporter, TMEM165/GDT1 family
LTAFWTAFIYVFLAEVGDKTQLMTLAFTAKYKAGVVLAAVSAATAVINLISVGLGEGLGKLLPMFWINIFAGTAFIIFGLWELRPEDENAEKVKESRLGPFMTVALAFFFAELGDKTMLAAVAIASKYHAFWQVWAGSTVGLIGSNAIAIVAGHALNNRISEKWMKIAIAIVYIGSGAFALYEAFRHH